MWSLLGLLAEGQLVPPVPPPVMSWRTVGGSESHFLLFVLGLLGFSTCSLPPLSFPGRPRMTGYHGTRAADSLVFLLDPEIQTPRTDGATSKTVTQRRGPPRAPQPSHTTENPTGPSQPAQALLSLPRLLCPPTPRRILPALLGSSEPSSCPLSSL